VREGVLSIEKVRPQAAAVRGDYRVRDNNRDIAVVGEFGAEIRGYGLRLAAFGRCNGGCRSPAHHAEEERHRKQNADVWR